MSFVEKISGLIPRLLGIPGGAFCILSGFLNGLSILTLNCSCVIAGITQVLGGFIVLMLEAPGCFPCFDFVNQLADGRPLWHRAVLYILIALFPLCFCGDISDLLPSALVFGSGLIYGIMGLRRQSSATDMEQAAVNSGLSNRSGQSTANDRTSIVNDAQPISSSGATGTDSDV